MRTFFYYGCIRKSIIKFLSMMDDIQITKYDSAGNPEKTVKVPVKYMPKKKFYSWLYERSHEKRYPMIGVEMTALEYDLNRATGTQEKVKVNIGDDVITYTTNPIPYNIGFRVSIATEYLHEKDQINEQLLPFFAPYIVTTVLIDELDIKWDMKVVFNGASLDTETDIAEDDYRNVLWSFDFSAETYLLKPTANINTVKKIVNKFYLSEESWDNRTSTEMPSGQGNEDAELLILGSKDDDEIMAQYLEFI